MTSPVTSRGRHKSAARWRGGPTLSFSLSRSFSGVAGARTALELPPVVAVRCTSDSARVFRRSIDSAVDYSTFQQSRRAITARDVRV